MLLQWTVFVVAFIQLLNFSCSQEEVTKPTFPDAFQVEIQGVFLDQKKEMDGAIYYDKSTNRVAVLLTYQNENKKFIYNFDNDEQLAITGNECSVSEISPENGAVFFPITTKDNKKVLSSPDEMFYFTNSKLDRQEIISDLPAYVYTAKVDFPFYQRKGCDVTHIFTNPEMETPDCEDNTCRPTLISISVRCLNSDGVAEVSHSYNFFRFRAKGLDRDVFQVPAGVFCDIKSQKPFPEFPLYFSFYYELVEQQDYDTTAQTSVYSVQKKVWYDSQLQLIRMDEFDNEGLLMSSRIYDIYGSTAYTVIASLAVCQPGPIDDVISLDKMTRLPRIVFSNNTSDFKTVYVGLRKVNGLDYEVWSLSYTDDESEAKVVQEFYFSEILPKDGQRDFKLKISHADISTYQKDDTTGIYELEVESYLKISNFRSSPKEWDAFDISSCYTSESKRGFKLKVDGPPTVKDSALYENILEKMYMRLIITTNVSVVRISELAGLFDGVYITEFTGWILEKSEYSDEKSGVKEPDMNETYRLLEDAAAAGKLNIKIKKGETEMQYIVTAVEEKKICNVTTCAEPKGPCFSGGSMAASSLTLFVAGVTIGLASYYVFLKKRRSRNEDTLKLNPFSSNPADGGSSH